jgi:pilus assembly protein CpaB
MKQKNVILMVVAVGCGLVAAFLTSTMGAKPAQTETRMVLVAAKDIPVGTLLTRDELKTLVKPKSLAKDAIGKDTAESEEDLVEKRLTRAVHADETINKGDLSKGGVITIPDGQIMVTLSMNASQAAAGFAGPGARVDLVTSVRLENRTSAMALLVNMLVLAIDGQTTYTKEGVFPSVSMVSFAANQKQALVLELAKSRGCQMSLLLRSPDAAQSEFEKNGYNIDDVLKLLQDDKNPISLGPVESGEVKAKRPQPKTVVVPAQEPKTPTEAPSPVAKETVKVPVALDDIKAGTPLTKDLLSDPTKFGTRELPKEFAQDALSKEQLDERVGQVFRTGLGKGQWVTESLVGSAEASLPKEDIDPPVRRRTHDVTIHTANDARTYRYEEVEPGRWRYIGPVRPDGKPATETEPRVPEKKVD